MTEPTLVEYRGEYHFCDELLADGMMATKCGQAVPAAEAYPVLLSQALPSTARCEACLTNEAVETATA